MNNRYEWMDKYCLAKKGVSKDLKEEWNNAVRYLVGGKMFAMFCGDKDDKPIITLKVEPAHGQLLRQEYQDIVPGYYMNKEHWNSVYLESDVSDEIIKIMIDESYQINFESLTKKAQKEVLES